MQYLVMGYDGKDEEALARRMAVREAHIALGDEMRQTGEQLYAAAILDDAGKMIGSVLICEFEGREQLDAWLKREPYVVGNVWQDIQVQPCRVGPSFAKAAR